MRSPLPARCWSYSWVTTRAAWRNARELQISGFCSPDVHASSSRIVYVHMRLYYAHMHLCQGAPLSFQGAEVRRAAKSKAPWGPSSYRGDAPRGVGRHGRGITARCRPWAVRNGSFNGRSCARMARMTAASWLVGHPAEQAEGTAQGPGFTLGRARNPARSRRVLQRDHPFDPARLHQCLALLARLVALFASASRAKSRQGPQRDPCGRSPISCKIEPMSLAMTRSEREAFLSAVHVGVISIERAGKAPLAVPIWYHFDPARRPGDHLGTRRWPRARGGGPLGAGRPEEAPALHQYASVEGPVISVAPPASRTVPPVALRYLGRELGDR